MLGASLLHGHGQEKQPSLFKKTRVNHWLHHPPTVGGFHMVYIAILCNLNDPPIQGLMVVM